MEKSEFLSERNALLELLWEMDEELRTLHQTRKYEMVTNRALANDVRLTMDRRHLIARELETEYGCKPWTFDPKRDNCWLVRPQVCAN